MLQLATNGKVKADKMALEDLRVIAGLKEEEEAKVRGCTFLSSLGSVNRDNVAR
jgi:hypothetical protein